MEQDMKYTTTTKKMEETKKKHTIIVRMTNDISDGFGLNPSPTPTVFFPVLTPSVTSPYRACGAKSVKERARHSETTFFARARKSY